MIEKMLVSFSGGRTSGYMSKMLKDRYSDKYDMVFVFANTGKEHEETLIFVDKVDKAFGLDLVWVEAVAHPGERKACTHKIVSFESASRNGEPFEDVIKKYGIPNISFPHCNRELKLNAIHSYMRAIQWDGYYTAIGIRADEQRRVLKDRGKINLIYPLVEFEETDKQDVNDWWEDQDFNLNIPEHMGNCVTCWKKSKKKLFKVILDNPDHFEFFRRMEDVYGDVGPNPAGGKRVFFRQNWSTDVLFQHFDNFGSDLDQGSFIFDMDSDGGCSESCEIFATT